MCRPRRATARPGAGRTCAGRRCAGGTAAPADGDPRSRATRWPRSICRRSPCGRPNTCWTSPSTQRRAIRQYRPDQHHRPEDGERGLCPPPPAAAFRPAFQPDASRRRAQDLAVDRRLLGGADRRRANTLDPDGTIPITDRRHRAAAALGRCRRGLFDRSRRQRQCRLASPQPVRQRRAAQPHRRHAARRHAP